MLPNNLPVNLNVSQDIEASQNETAVYVRACAIKKMDGVYRRELNNTGGWVDMGKEVRSHLCNGSKCPQLLPAQLRAACLLAFPPL